VAAACRRYAASGLPALIHGAGQFRDDPLRVSEYVVGGEPQDDPAGRAQRVEAAQVLLEVGPARGDGLPRTPAQSAHQGLLNRRVVKLSALRAYAVGHVGWPGTALLRDVICLAEPLSESPMETRLRLLLVDAGAPRPVAQYDVRDARGRFLARVDLAYG
jgi:hypothetical protein